MRGAGSTALGRVGHLLANRFDAWVMRDEAVWERTCRYILDNLANAGICAFAEACRGRVDG
jgi:hypothetical protein